MWKSDQMWSKKAGRTAVSDCRHTEVITTETAGLNRSSCANCGHVSVGFGFAMWQDTDVDQESLVDQG